MIIAQIQHPTNQQLPIRSRPPPQTPALIQRSHTLIAHTQRPRPTTHTLHQHPTHIADINIDNTTVVADILTIIDSATNCTVDNTPVGNAFSGVVNNTLVANGTIVADINAITAPVHNNIIITLNIIADTNVNGAPNRAVHVTAHCATLIGIINDAFVDNIFPSVVEHGVGFVT